MACGRYSEDRGATSVEYGLIAVAVAAVIALIVFSIGEIVSEMFTDSCAAVHDEVGTAADCQ